MKKILIIISMIFLFVACNSNTNQTKKQKLSPTDSIYYELMHSLNNPKDKTLNQKILDISKKNMKMDSVLMSEHERDRKLMNKQIYH